MKITTSYKRLQSLTYEFTESEVMEQMKALANKHALNHRPDGSTVNWDADWWDRENGKLVVELVCRFAIVEKGEDQ